MIKQPGILITRNTFHINDTWRFKSVHFQDIIKSNSVSQAITETPRAMSKKYTRISKSHIVKRNRRDKVAQCYFLGELQPDSLVFRKLPYSRDVYFAEVNA